MLKIDNVSKQYKLGQIGGTTLRDELQRLNAKIRKKEDPTKRIGAKDYNKGETFMALDGVSFEVKKGERVGIIGHNGAGKSTLLKLISRVTAPTGGEIGLNGRVASMLEVGTGFHGELTGRENIYMNGAILGMTKKEIDAKMEDIIEFSECRQFIDTPVKRYSSGMYVKLAFSVAAHLDSEIMIMDEVLAVGDMAFQKKCLDKMSDVSKKDGRTILYVSHNMNTIRKLCDRVIVLNRGTVEFDGNVEQGIGYYMETVADITKVFYDLSNKSSLDFTDIKAKVLSVKILEKDNAVYNKGENLSSIIKIKANKKVTELKLRMELHYSDGTPVGTVPEIHLGLLQENTTGSYRITFDTSLLTRGKYYFDLVTFEKISTNSIDYDIVLSSFFFEIQDQLDIEWNTSNWGHILINAISERVN